MQIMYTRHSGQLATYSVGHDLQVVKTGPDSPSPSRKWEAANCAYVSADNIFRQEILAKVLPLQAINRQLENPNTTHLNM